MGNPGMGTLNKQALAVQLQRLSKAAPGNGDAIVRPYGNENRRSQAEMTWPTRKSR